MKQNISTLEILDTLNKEIHVTAGTAFAIHPDGDAIAIIELEPGHGLSPTQDPPDLSDLRVAAGKPVYRISINTAKLAMIAAALGEKETITLCFPKESTAPIHILGENGTGWLMASSPDDGVPEGLLVPAATKGTEKSAPKPAKEKEEITLPPPVVIASEQRKTLEIDFQGKPSEDTRNAIKSPDLGFRYSGRGTKRGVPPKMWYGPNNPYTREKIKELFPEAQFKQAA